MYFDESAVSVVDSWLKSSTPAEEAPKKKLLSQKPAPAAEPSAAVGGRHGLGYEAPKVKGKSKAEIAVEGVLKNIQKKKKYVAPSADQFESHGVVEEEISRTKSTKPINASADKKKDNLNASSAGSSAAVEEVGQLVEAAPKSKGFSKDAGAKANNAKKNVHSSDKKEPSEYKSVYADNKDKGSGSGNKRSLPGPAEGVEQPVRERKRTKTRSKQKNIRRDKRTDAFKPEHLRLGSEEYCGYDLTKVI